ncbi:hypothetical protein SLEP1_g26668 [Rubroshorea leprosula]|uniref:Uncharacterized protein n=1 Tax=Rubroshorea leprosula TaxID=152421 RepID=A0AAV5JZ15_9ROSI|nr:hypothetical protein SLEP1_g26668 [Rubroshorea leprosula]
MSILIPSLKITNSFNVYSFLIKTCKPSIQFSIPVKWVKFSDHSEGRASGDLQGNGVVEARGRQRRAVSDEDDSDDSDGHMIDEDLDEDFDELPEDEDFDDFDDDDDNEEEEDNDVRKRKK